VGLLDELSKYKFNPNATSMGLLQAGAQMLANSGPSYQPQGGFGSALGQGLGGFTQGYMGFNQDQQEQALQKARIQALNDQLELQKTQREALKGFDIKDPNSVNALFRNGLVDEGVKLQKAFSNPGGVDPYFSAVSTPQGLMSFNARTGEMTPINVGGQPVMKSTDDIGLQGSLSQIRDANQYEKIKLPDGREVMMPKGTAAQLSGYPQYQAYNPAPMRETVGNVTYDFKNPQQAMQDIKTGIREGGSGDAELDALVAASQRQYEQRNGIGQSTADKAAIETQAAIDKAAGVERAKNLVSAQESLPQAMHEAQYTEKLIDELMTHPGMSGVIGVPNGKELFPGTKESSFNVRRSQLDGRAFLQAFQSLKGGGQITEVEGAKATAAIARLGRTQSEEEYKSALMELKQMLNDAREIAKVKAGGMQQQGVPLDDKRARLEALRAKHLRQQQ
jgi:hypothetical protein